MNKPKSIYVLANMQADKLRLIPDTAIRDFYVSGFVRGAYAKTRQLHRKKIK